MGTIHKHLAAWREKQPKQPALPRELPADVTRVLSSWIGQAEIGRLTKDVERERSLAGAAQIEAAQARLKVESQAEQVTDLKAELVRMNAAFSAEVQRRPDAERKAAVIETERAALRKEVDEERGRINGLQAHLDKAHADMEALRGSR